MSKRGDEVDWSKLANASPKPKRLHLEEHDSDGLFHCPVQACNNDGFTTQRGCRKHVKNKHRWYFYFDEKPNSTHIEAFQDQATKTKLMTRKLYVKSGQLPLLTCQATLLKNFCPGSPAVAGAVKVIAKHNKLSAGA